MIYFSTCISKVTLVFIYILRCAFSIELVFLLSLCSSLYITIIICFGIFKHVGGTNQPSMFCLSSAKEDWLSNSGFRYGNLKQKLHSLYPKGLKHNWPLLSPFKYIMTLLVRKLWNVIKFLFAFPLYFTDALLRLTLVMFKSDIKKRILKTFVFVF